MTSGNILDVLVTNPQNSYNYVVVNERFNH